MICPACRSKNEMLFSALSHGFVCQEADCGLEIEMEMQDAEVLLRQEEEELTFA